MKTYLAIFLLLGLIFAKKSHSQNLVSNPGFEIFVECPDTSMLQFYSLLDSTWYQFNSADYFNSCVLSGNRSVPQNAFGFQNAHSGNAYVGFSGYYATTFSREYIEDSLYSPLSLGQKYYVRFYVSLADSMWYAIENIGALFTDSLFDPYPPPTYSWVTATPQIENTGILNDKIGWTEVIDSFVASGGEKYVSIGNFRNDGSTNIQFMGGVNPTMKGAYYYIDDVYVGASPPPVGIKENEIDDNFSIYPNPAQSEINLELELVSSERLSIEISNVFGQVVYRRQEELPNSGQQKLTINVADLVNGLYLIKLKGEKESRTIRFVKQ